MADAADHDDCGNATEKLIRKRSADDVYSDEWYCPACHTGTMAPIDGDACEPLDGVRCNECDHECQLRNVVFIRGDICTLLEALDDARAELADLRRQLDQRAREGGERG